MKTMVIVALIVLSAAASLRPAAAAIWQFPTPVAPARGAGIWPSSGTPTSGGSKRARTAQDNQSEGERATYWCLPVGAEPGASGFREPGDPRGPKGK
jgi:hypothetical protein